MTSCFQNFKVENFDDTIVNTASVGLKITTFNPAEIMPGRFEPACEARSAGFTCTTSLTSHFNHFCVFPTKDATDNIKCVVKDVITRSSARGFVHTFLFKDCSVKSMMCTQHSQDQFYCSQDLHVI